MGLLSVLVGALSISLLSATASPSFDGKLRKDADGSTVAYMIPPYKSNHAASLEVLPDGTLCAAWFSGEKEEASDCAIVFARLPAGTDQWSNASTLSIRDKFSNQNPVLFYENQTGILHLYHSQAPAESGESLSTIYHLESHDHGTSWTKPTPWLTDPGAFPRNRIIPNLKGGLIFPIYNASKAGAMKENYAIMDISDSSRTKWVLNVVANSGDLVQPSVVRLANDSLVAFFRDRRAKNIYRALSHTDGVSWTTPEPTELPNNNAGIEANMLLSSNLIIVFNDCSDCKGGRTPLTVATSETAGTKWEKKRNIQVTNDEDVSDGVEFSYPTVLQTSDGNIHVMYTYDRDTIKYKRFDEAWIAQTTPEN